MLKYFTLRHEYQHAKVILEHLPCSSCRTKEQACPYPPIIVLKDKYNSISDYKGITVYHIEKDEYSKQFESDKHKSAGITLFPCYDKLDSEILSKCAAAGWKYDLRLNKIVLIFLFLFFSISMAIILKYNEYFNWIPYLLFVLGISNIFAVVYIYLLNDKFKHSDYKYTLVPESYPSQKSKNHYYWVINKYSNKKGSTK